MKAITTKTMKVKDGEINKMKEAKAKKAARMMKNKKAAGKKQLPPWLVKKGKKK